MKIIVTGGAGFIGANFLDLMVPRYPEHEFMCLDKLGYASNPLEQEAFVRAPNHHFHRIDIADLDALEEFFSGHRPDLVIHFAAESHVDRSIHGPRAFVRTNIEGTFNVLEMCRRYLREGGFLHHVSTDEVYGSLDGGPGDPGAFTEDSPYAPSSPYAASKAASDHLVRAWAHTYGLGVKITNACNNYGPRQFPEKFIPLVILACIERKPVPIYGTGTNVRDWLHVSDHCEAIWRVIERGRLGHTYNIGGRSERTNLDVVDAICDAVARHTGASVDDLRALKTFVADRPGHDHRYAIDPDKIERECDWRATESFASGLDKTVRWYLDNPTWLRSVRSTEYRRWMRQNYAER